MYIFLSEKSCPKILVIPPNLIYISSMINEFNIRKANKSRISKKNPKKPDHKHERSEKPCVLTAFSEFLKV
jgi:hypothetical protein